MTQALLVCINPHVYSLGKQLKKLLLLAKYSVEVKNFYNFSKVKNYFKSKASVASFDFIIIVSKLKKSEVLRFPQFAETYQKLQYFSIKIVLIKTFGFSNKPSIENNFLLIKTLARSSDLFFDHRNLNHYFTKVGFSSKYCKVFATGILNTMELVNKI